MYHVIVVTQLFYFKTPSKHKESDIVQFMVGIESYSVTSSNYNMIYLQLLIELNKPSILLFLSI